MILEKEGGQVVARLSRITAIQQAVNEMLARERHVIEGHPNLDDQGRAEQLATLEQTVANQG